MSRLLPSNGIAGLHIAATRSLGRSRDHHFHHLLHDVRSPSPGSTDSRYRRNVRRSKVD